MVHLTQIVQNRESLRLFGEVHPPLPAAGVDGFKEDPSSIEIVDDNGICVPEHEKERGILHITPAGLPNQASLPQPVNKDSHGKEKKKMSDLVDIKALGSGVHLRGLGARHRKQHTQKTEDAFMDMKGTETTREFRGPHRQAIPHSQSSLQKQLHSEFFLDNTLS
jgi:hypothetical protein